MSAATDYVQLTHAASEIDGTIEEVYAARGSYGNLSLKIASKQDELSQSQLAAVNSGITDEKLTNDEAALVELVDSGAKNKFDPAYTWDSMTIYGITITRNGDTYSIASGTTQSGNNDFINMRNETHINTNLIPAGDWVLSFDTPQQNVRLQACWNGALRANSSFGTNLFFTVPENTTDSWVRIVFKGSTDMTGTSFKIMLCPRVLWDVSHKYVPYCPTIAEMYAMILELQNGTRSAPALALAKAEPEEIKEPETGEEEMR